MEENKSSRLPDNAYRPLHEGEKYTPLLPARENPREVTPYSVLMGIIMAILFSAATAYLGLKVGQVFEAAIPIAILAVGIGSLSGKKNMLGKRNHSIHRSLLRGYCSRCYFHSSRPLHFAIRGRILANLPLFFCRGMSRDTPSHSLPSLLCTGDAW